MAAPLALAVRGWGDSARAVCGERRGELRQTPIPGNAMLRVQAQSPASASASQPSSDKKPSSTATRRVLLPVRR